MRRLQGLTCVFLLAQLSLTIKVAKFPEQCQKYNLLKNLFIYLFLEKGERRERNTDWLPLAYPQPGAWPTTQACALTGNKTSDLLVCRSVLNALSHTIQGQRYNLKRNHLLQYVFLRNYFVGLQKVKSNTFLDFSYQKSWT